jgi:hypothetical protein
MPTPPRSLEPEEEQFARSIEKEVEAKFYLRLRRDRKAETLEEVQDSCKLVIGATTLQGFSSAKFHFHTQSDITATSTDVLKMWARSVADVVVEKLVDILPKPENRFVLLMTPILFWADATDVSAETFCGHIWFDYFVDEIDLHEIGWS